MRRERLRTYTFEFYSIISEDSDLFSMSVTEAFDEIITGDRTSSFTSYGSTKELYDLRKWSSAKSYAGEIRRIRQSELPEVGALGRKSKQLELDPDEGVIERNFFVYHADNSLLVFHRNDDGNSASHLAQLLTVSAGVPFFAHPVIQPDQAENLLLGKMDIKRFAIRIPKPTNPMLYPQNSTSARTLELLENSGADSIEVIFSIDKKIDTSAGRLSSALQSSIGSLLSLGATKANLELDENGRIYPVDLIANRLYSKQSISTNSTFPSSEVMYQLADKAKTDQEVSINEYFGTTSRII
ncbi:DUF6731 family protein [Pseudomonas coronafaciens]|uniref:DUF6731 family protein n=1 Tax=Pseudomonas coronafaciens TaxID=53409 RepID=UPI0006B40DD2|nr:DUF6731 family protein [Pseudomonas coronafaciens]